MRRMSRGSSFRGCGAGSRRGVKQLEWRAPTLGRNSSSARRMQHLRIMRMYRRASARASSLLEFSCRKLW